MSEMLDSVLAKNLLNLALDQPLLPELAAPGHSRLNRSASFFSPPSSSCSSSTDSSDSCSLSSSEHVNYSDVGGSLWSSNIWSQGPAPEPRPTSEPRLTPFRADRSMSLTESTSSLLSTFRQLKNLEAFPPATGVPPPPGFGPSPSLAAHLQPMASPNRYKTELCRGFQETGSCKYGSKCQFAHGEAELRGLYRHPKYKTEPCRTFYNFGYCPYGSRCHFIHEDKLGGGPPPAARLPAPPHPQQQTAPPTLRHQLRQSLSFAGFLGSSRGSPPPAAPTFDLSLAFSRAPSVSPPPADLLSPVFAEALQREATAFHFGGQQSGAGEARNIPLILEPQSSSPPPPPRCVCGHGNNSGIRAFQEEEAKLEIQAGIQRGLQRGLQQGLQQGPQRGLQRSSSEDSLDDSYSSSGGSSGSQSPTFDGSASKRLIVFERLSLSD